VAYVGNTRVAYNIPVNYLREITLENVIVEGRIILK
jgi:hypothetical protein